MASSSIYGGTYNLISVTMKKMGVDVTFVDPDCAEEELNAAFQELSLIHILLAGLPPAAMRKVPTNARKTASSWRLPILFRFRIAMMTAIRITLKL